MIVFLILNSTKSTDKIKSCLPFADHVSLSMSAIYTVKIEKYFIQVNFIPLYTGSSLYSTLYHM